jgi:putative sporulation protein YtaF
MFYKLIIIILVLSMDAFGIGITYGVRGIKISNTAKIIITTQSILITLVAMKCGAFLKPLFPKNIAPYIGTFLLLSLGFWIIFQCISDIKTTKSKAIKTPLLNHLGITTKIISSPQSCDLDNSAVIDKFEAIYLGFALSIDAFGAIIGVGMIDTFSYTNPFLLAFTQVVLLALGSSTGKKIKTTCPINPKFWTLLSGFLLIIIAILSLFI